MRFQNDVEIGIETDGSNLSGVSGQCLWQEYSSSQSYSSINAESSRGDEEDDKENSDFVDEKNQSRSIEGKSTKISPNGELVVYPTSLRLIIVVP